MTKTQAINFFLVLLVILTSWLWWHRTNHNHPTEKKLQKPTMLMKQVTAVRMTLKGLPKYQLQSPIIEFYNGNQKIFFTDPILTMYSTTEPTWVLRAKYAVSNKNFDVLHLSHHVTIDQNKTEKHAATHVTTSRLTVYPPRHFASSNQVVTLTQGADTIRGKGMRANMKQGWIKLLSHVKAQYEIKNTSNHP